ncbi:MAG: AbrB/MazE/SpoVT family DNA-binding domain-containing protein [Halobacteriota archaeon]|uniref:AbrB/MazE/SpoVT family DNA-binding domain-containing protein n=1 Tax=Halanaeroarchaeum sp. HSR-CO TaxID=2866382 RepID=UPI00217D2D86|nr:AbrB/MazE/SpoVT family DNA-binding domain-containing protein [Halanaeroarchaeum sp. HSR-CO]UWG46317.1 AbrB family transcriptional regulator [Halanaeroarchaeum sp. HSR-CO]
MSKSTDDRGRIYLPKDVRERFGDQYRIVELPGHVALFPVDDDPVEGLREAVGDAFAGTDVGDLTAEIREKIDDEVANESEERP